jgi:hypothetical protein
LAIFPQHQWLVVVGVKFYKTQTLRIEMPREIRLNMTFSSKRYMGQTGLKSMIESCSILEKMGLEKRGKS